MSKYVQLGGMFWKSDEAVFCEGRRLKLDPRNTRIFFDTWAADDRRVYCHTMYMSKIDAVSFVALNNLYAKDQTNCYATPSGLTVGWKLIKGADAYSFEAIDSGCERLMFGWGQNFNEGFAKDASHVYFDGDLVKNADPTSFTSLGNCYGRDAKSVFFSRFRLNGTDPMRWRYIGGYYSRDDKHVYYENRRVKDVRLDHVRHIEPFDSEFAYDGQTFFCRGEPTTTEYYVECLRSNAKFGNDFADLVESGAWQRNVQQGERSYRAPDDILMAFQEVQLGNSKSDVLRRIGDGVPVPREQWNVYFPPLNELIRTGLLVAAGTAPWSGEDGMTPEGCEVLLWSHPEEVLACSFVGQKVVALVVLDADSVGSEIRISPDLEDGPSRANRA
jgi:hypothetical protein